MPHVGPIRNWRCLICLCHSYDSPNQSPMSHTPSKQKVTQGYGFICSFFFYVARPVENSITLGSMMESMKIGQREEVINLEGKPWEDTTMQYFFTSKWEEELATSVQRSSILTLFFVRSSVSRRILNHHTQRGSFKIWVIPFKLDPPRLLLSFCWSGPYKGWEYGAAVNLFLSRVLSQRSQEEKTEEDVEIKGNRLSRESEGTETSSVYYLAFPFQCCLRIWAIRKKGF